MQIRTVIVSAGLCLALANVASAGLKQTQPVSVDLVNRVASGALGAARNSPDNRQVIGCGVEYDAVNRKNNVNCSATDAAGKTGQCATQQAELIQIALGINGDSVVQFFWDAKGSCTNIVVINSSMQDPKQP